MAILTNVSQAPPMVPFSQWCFQQPGCFFFSLSFFFLFLLGPPKENYQAPSWLLKWQHHSKLWLSPPVTELIHTAMQCCLTMWQGCAAPQSFGDPPSIQTFFNFKSAQSLCLLRHCCSSTSWTMKKIQLQPFQRRPVPVASFDLDFQMRIQGQLMLFELPQFYLLNHKEDHMMLTTFAFSKQTVSRLHSTS